MFENFKKALDKPGSTDGKIMASFYVLGSEDRAQALKMLKESRPALAIKAANWVSGIVAEEAVRPMMKALGKHMKSRAHRLMGDPTR